MIHGRLNPVMDQSNGDQFKAELFRKHDPCKKVLIPKDQYNMIQDLKVTASNNRFIYLGFYVAFNTVQVIRRRVVGRAEETST